MQNSDIHKAGGIIIRDRKFLVTRAKGKQFFVAPGGKVEAGETVHDALIRELKEELGIETTENDFQEFGSFFAAAADKPDKKLQMDVFVVTDWRGEITALSEIEELRWITSQIPSDIKVGSIFEHDVLPKLKSQGLID